mgnify:CR=1 FL=1
MDNPLKEILIHLKEQPMAALIKALEHESLLSRLMFTPLDVHLLISSFCFYRVSNRHTVGEIFQIDLPDERIKQRHREMICESVLRYLQA